MIVEYYDSKYKEDLACMLCSYYLEIHGSNYTGNINLANDMIDTLLANNSFIYLLIDTDTKQAVGFVVLYRFNQYGMVKDYVCIDHMYIIPKYRSGRAVVLLYTTVGKAMKWYGIDGVGTTMVNSTNKRNNKLVGGKVIAEVTIFSLQDIESKLNKYMRRLNVR